MAEEDKSGLFTGSDVGDPDTPVLNDTEDTRDYLDELVGEGKKFIDGKALAKGKALSDEFITRLQTENSGLRKELNTRLSLEEFLEKTQNKAPEPGTSTEPVQGEGGTQDVQVSQEDIKNLVTKTVTETQQKHLLAQNLSDVREVLQSHWGNEFAYKLTERAAELGLGEEFMNSLASSNPRAFYELVGIVPKKTADPYDAPPVSSIRSVPVAGNPQNFEYYTKLRKENPAKYWTPKIQNEVYEQAKKQGDSFYNT